MKIDVEKVFRDQLGMNGIIKDISSKRLPKETLHSEIRTRHQESSCREANFEEISLPVEVG